mgnify:CR=1 FL=1
MPRLRRRRSGRGDRTRKIPKSSTRKEIWGFYPRRQGKIPSGISRAEFFGDHSLSGREKPEKRRRSIRTGEFSSASTSRISLCDPLPGLSSSIDLPDQPRRSALWPHSAGSPRRSALWPHSAGSARRSTPDRQGWRAVEQEGCGRARTTAFAAVPSCGCQTRESDEADVVHIGAGPRSSDAVCRRNPPAPCGFRLRFARRSRGRPFRMSVSRFGRSAWSAAWNLEPWRS